ncbi:MAG: nitrate reductase, partial [Varibaculum cambriense]|nr:nitrate reductase [Varibaculum cambriense]
IVVYHVMRGISKARGTFLEQASPASVPAGTDLESRSYEKRVASS